MFIQILNCINIIYDQPVPSDMLVLNTVRTQWYKYTGKEVNTASDLLSPPPCNLSSSGLFA